MKAKLSAYIIDHGNERDLTACLASIENAVDRWVVIHEKEAPYIKDIAGRYGRPLTLVSIDGDLEAGLTQAIRKANGGWILIIRAGEILSPLSAVALRELMKESKESAYYVTCRTPPPSGRRQSGQDRYEWLGNVGKYRSQNVLKLSGLAVPEVRLFRRKRFKQLLIRDDRTILPIFDISRSSFPVSCLRLERHSCPPALEDRQTEEQKEIQDYERYMNDPVESLSLYDEFKFLAPNSFGYAIMDETHYPGIMEGLEKGWGHEEILKFMLFNLIKNGDYEKALDYSAAITSKLGDVLEVWRLRGDAFFYLLNLKQAAACYEKALTIQSDDRPILFNLSKVYLISNEYEKARHLLLELKNDGASFPEIDFLLNSIDEKRPHGARLSLLMLCKDEEDYIARALDSVKDIVDEMVVVDTGSRDRTVSIAEAFGAKVITHAWNDHFSDARNAGLAHVTGDYVLWMDADEFICRADQISLLVFKHILSTENRKGIRFRVESFKEEQHTPDPLPPENITKRTGIFPKLEGICFSGRIFESVDASMDNFGINVISAENVRFLHISDNSHLRMQRKIQALEKCTLENLEPEYIFKGIPYWLETKNPEKAEEWLEEAVKMVCGQTAYDKIIAFLTSAFIQSGYLDIHSRLFNLLVSTYPHTDSIASQCANMLYHAGSYQAAANLFEKYLCHVDRSDAPADGDLKRLSDLILFAAASLEIDQLASCDAVVRQLVTSENTYDAIQALRFYAEIRRRDIEKGIAILDAWIRHRKLEINATLNSIADLTRIILRMVEIMTTYGQMNASVILSRSCRHLIETFTLKE